MKRGSIWALLASAALGAIFAQRALTQTSPPAAPATSASAPAWPADEVTRYTFKTSKIYPGTTRDYWIYVPRQYDPARPACLFVDQDNVQFNAPAVFDQLIASKEMPVTIGVFIQPGRNLAATPQALDRYNRSQEYDQLSDEYARFLLDELLPEVETRKAPDGRPIKLSRNPDDRAIGGSSSGAIAAFNAAWERPDSFHRVFSAIGTYVGLRGGNIFPTLVRKYEPKPIRVFLQDGSNDQNIYGGDWWMANQEMERALVFAGYEVNHAWGTGVHSSADATAGFAESMKWLWKDYPQPVKVGLGSEMMKEILIPGEDWKEVAGPFSRVDAPATAANGEVVFCDTGAKQSYKINLDGQAMPWQTAGDVGTGQAIGPDNRQYRVTGDLLHTVDNGKTFEVTGFHGNDLTIAHNGNIYVSESGGSGANAANQVWLVRPDGTKKVIDTGLKYPNGITLSPDQSLLYVSDYRSHWVYSYVIQPDGTLADKERYFDLYQREADDDAACDGMRVDRDGRLYVTTRAGIQVCDQAGRVNAIIPTPPGPNGNTLATRVSALTFGGKDLDLLYVFRGDKIYVRKLKTRGVLPFEEPIKPAPPKL